MAIAKCGSSFLRVSNIESFKSLSIREWKKRQNKLTSACYTQANELSKLTNHSVGFCEATLWKDLVRISTAQERFFLSRLAKKLGTYKRVSNFFKLGVIPILSLLIFLLKQTNKGVVRSGLNTKYFKFPFVLLYVQLYNCKMIAMITMPVVCFGHSLQQIGCAVR